MVILQVLLVGNPLLRDKSETVTDFGPELRPALKDLRDTLTNHQEITGSTGASRPPSWATSRGLSAYRPRISPPSS